MGFLFTRRWLLFLAAVAVLAYGCVWLGEWQFHRLHEREARNSAAERNLAMSPAPVDQVASVRDAIARQFGAPSTPPGHVEAEACAIRADYVNGSPVQIAWLQIDV